MTMDNSLCCARLCLFLCLEPPTNIVISFVLVLVVLAAAVDFCCVVTDHYHIRKRIHTNMIYCRTNGWHRKEDQIRIGVC